VISSAPVHEIAVDTVSRWESFFQRTEYMQKVREIADLYPELSSIIVDFQAIDHVDSDLAEQLLDHPDACLAAGREAICNLMHQDMRHASIALRVTRLPRDARVRIRDLRGRHIGRLVAFPALVTRSVQPKHNIIIGAFQCARCGQVVMEQMRDRAFQEPLECYKDQDGCGRTSSSTKFRLISERSSTEDVQKIECQEPLDDLVGGASPARMTVWLSGELAGTVSAGARVIVNGIMRTVRGNGKSAVLDAEVDAISIEQQSQRFTDIEITPEEEAEFEKASKDPQIFDHLVSSIAPAIKGYENEKAGLLLQLFGGVPKQLDDGSRRRGDIHILLVGDPGVAKSQLLEYMSHLAPHGVYASGKSSSGVGLTCAATRDADWGEGQWTLQAGAMVQANGGNLFVDELDKMTAEDRSAMHEGLESQRITVHKAGLDATLPTECSLAAAANPKYGRFEDTEELAAQIDLPDTLQSRFDLIYMMRDKPNLKVDRDIASHILQAHRRGGALLNRYEVGMDAVMEDTAEIAPTYSMDWLRKYIAWSKRVIPVMTTTAAKLIEDQYVTIRATGQGQDSSVPITARQLEGYVRLSEAMARARHSKAVEPRDAKLAIDLCEYALQRVSGSGESRDVDRIMSGTSKKDRSKILLILEIIRSAGRQGISRTEVSEVAHERHRIEEHETATVLTRLLERGEIMYRDMNKGIVAVV
jgi:replicative DNA helicase Mcm